MVERLRRNGDSPVGPGPSLIWGAGDATPGATRCGFSTGRVSRARLLPAHPEDRGRDRHHVPRRGLPLRADLSRNRLGRHARAAGDTLPPSNSSVGTSGRCFPGSSPRPPRVVTTLRDPVDACAVGVAVRTPACGSPLLRRSAPAGPEFDDLGARTTAEPTGPQPGRRSHRRRPGRRAARNPLPDRYGAQELMDVEACRQQDEMSEAELLERAMAFLTDCAAVGFADRLDDFAVRSCSRPRLGTTATARTAQLGTGRRSA